MGKKKVTTKTRPGPNAGGGKKVNDSLLIELRTEELPPKSLERLSQVFADTLYASLKEQGFLAADSTPRVFATPRRLAVLISDVLPKQPERMVERKGPAVSAGMGADGKPSPALLGFARSCGVEAGKLQKRTGDKGEYFVHCFTQKGVGLAQQLAMLVEAALKKLPVAKLMRWGDKEAQFVRPVHGLIMLHGRKVVAGEVLGLKSGNKTLGHRFLSKGVLIISAASEYEKILEKKGLVIADYQRRRDMIAAQLDGAAKKIGAATRWDLGNHAGLLNEVASIVEYPVVYAGGFSQDFLEVPRECLIISMQQHQKYFPLADRQGKLQPRFLFVSNLPSSAPRQVIHGNERVLRARLSDARFFYEQDMKTPLAARVPRLADVVYHNKLGSQLERAERLRKLAGEIARRLQADDAAAGRAAYLAKADLLTEMVGEFPELQGVMGKYYARHDKEPNLVAEAIEEHYFPRTSGGELPESDIAVAVALADKLDTLVGIYGAGLIPTGDKDPFGLRRAALGVVRILIEKSLNLDVRALLLLARGHFPPGVMSDGVEQDLYGFILGRLRPYLQTEQGFEQDEIEAVLALDMARLDQIKPRLDALRAFRRLPEAAALAAANKRIHNILKQAGDGGMEASTLDARLLVEDTEKDLAQRLGRVSAEVAPMFTAGRYTDALKKLAQLGAPVDAFFDKVMVMAEDQNLRRSRLTLLYQIRQLFLQAADISRLQG